MPTRRFLLVAAPVALAAAARASTAQAASNRAVPGSFRDFLTGVRAEARRAGIASATLDRAFAGVSPNQKVLDRDRHQPEFTLTWARYRALVITDKRIVDGRQASPQTAACFNACKRGSVLVPV